MCTSLSCRTWHRQIIAALICLWLGAGPILAFSSLWEAGPECCCGGETMCLLAGCDCDGTESAQFRDCGGLRSADGANEQAIFISFVRNLGCVGLGSSVDTFLPTGRIELVDSSLTDPPTPAPDRPPPRPRGAL